MMPILHERDETNFTSNGLGRLRDCISCVVTEGRNEVYECDFEYPVTGAHFDEIICGRIIAVEHDHSADIQPFDIVSCSRPIDGKVSFHAVHISYRQSKMAVSGTNINSLADAFTMLKNASPSNPFTYETDMESTGYMASADGEPRSVRQFLGGVEGSILDTYGGEYEWDKFRVILHGSRGQDRALTIRYGVNLTEYTEDLDYIETYSAVIPFWKGQDANGKDLIVKGSMVDSGFVTYNGRIECVPLDLTDKFETQPTVSQLETMARSFMSGHNITMPARSISINFLRLQDSPEYAHLASLYECQLCDTIRVVFPMYGQDARYKIVKTVYDVLLERYTEMELGTLSTSLAEALGVGGDSSSSSSGVQIQKETITGTTNAWGAFFLSTIPSGATVLSVDTDGNMMCIPWLHLGTQWYAKVVNWQSMAAVTNTQMTVNVRYLV